MKSRSLTASIDDPHEELERVIRRAQAGRRGFVLLVDQLVVDRGHRVRALTRDSGSAAAARLRLRGADIVAGDLDDPPSLHRAAAGADAVFVLSTPHHGTGPAAEARQAISALRGDDLPAIEDLAGTFPGATFTVTGTPREPSSEAKLALYRTAQEALTNVRRHAEADHARVELGLDGDRAYLEVSDDGRGFDVERARTGIGRQSMNHRALELGGRLGVHSAPGEGTRVRFSIPLSRLLEE